MQYLRNREFNQDALLINMFYIHDKIMLKLNSLLQILTLFRYL